MKMDLIITIILLLYYIYFLAARKQAYFQLLHELRELLELKVPLPEALEQIANRITFKPLKKRLLESVLPELRSGKTLGQALKKTSYILPTFFLLFLLIIAPGIFLLIIPFIKWHMFTAYQLRVLSTGEENGLLPEALSILLEREEFEKAEKRLLKRVSYHYIFILFAFFVMSIFLNTYILPTIVNLFEEMQIPLPFISKLFIAFVKILKNPVYLISILAIFLGMFVIWKTPSFRDPLLIRLPIIRWLVRYREYITFTRGLALSLEKDAPLDKGLQFAEATSGNVTMQRVICAIKKEIIKGIAFSKALEQKRFIPAFFPWMIYLGEGSNLLPQMLHEIADWYSKEIPLLLRIMKQRFTLILTLGMGVITAFYVLAVFLLMAKLQTQFVEAL